MEMKTVWIDLRHQKEMMVDSIGPGHQMVKRTALMDSGRQMGMTDLSGLGCQIERMVDLIDFDPHEKETDFDCCQMVTNLVLLGIRLHHQTGTMVVSPAD
jgi:hypothetical protein